MSSFIDFFYLKQNSSLHTILAIYHSPLDFQFYFQNLLHNTHNSSNQNLQNLELNINKTIETKKNSTK